MCKDKLHDFLHALPKCEHHVHIEGTLTPELLFSLSSRKSIALPKDDPAFESDSRLHARYESFTSLSDFLHYYYISTSVLTEAGDFEQLAKAYFKRAHADGVAHAEISFDPQAHLVRGVPFSEVILGLSAARTWAERELHISTELICCFLRHLPVPAALSLFESEEFQEAWGNGLISGIGLDSNENDYPPELFTELYLRAQRKGIRLTAHAGEEASAQNIRTAVDMLHCTRVDHGIRLVDDPELMQFIVSTGRMLTVCPLSNVKLKCVEKVEDVPIRRFLDAGVRFSVNSDDPAYFGGFLLANYCAVQEAFQLTVEEWLRVCEWSIDGSWCGAARKDDLRKALQAVHQQFTNS